MSARRRLLLLLLSIFFVAAGVSHFLAPSFYAHMVPPWLPDAYLLVYVSGVFEILLGLLVLVPATRTLAAWGLVLLLFAVFPANIHMAVHQLGFVDGPRWLPQPTPLGLWLRLPLQFVLIAWAWSFTRADEPPAGGRATA